MVVFDGHINGSPPQLMSDILTPLVYHFTVITRKNIDILSMRLVIYVNKQTIWIIKQFDVTYLYRIRKIRLYI